MVKALRRNRSEAVSVYRSTLADGVAMYDAAKSRRRAQDCIEQAEDARNSPQLAMLRMTTVLLELAERLSVSTA
jgi:hypothetical protein